MTQHPAAAAQRPSTIHSFALSVLLRNPGAGDLPSPLRIADDLEYDEIVRPTLAGRAGVPQPKLDRLVKEMAANWESLREEHDARVTAEERSRFLGAWHEHRRIYGYTLLQELPYALRHALHNHSDLVGVSFDLLIVDEYQDLNACDLAVLKLIADRGCSVIGAGDDDQSIYSGRKAAPEGIRRFLTDYPGAADYSMSVTQRCGSRIIEWAAAIIEGDPDRPQGRPRLTSAAQSPPGEVGLLSFQNQDGEARGVAGLVERLVKQEGVPPEERSEIARRAVMVRWRKRKPIKEWLAETGIACADPDAVNRILETKENRRLLATLRLMCNQEDSLAWATLLHLTHGIGRSFLNHVYDRARENGVPFGPTLLTAYEQAFAGAPAAPAKRAVEMVARVVAWLNEHELRGEPPEPGWGRWIVDLADDEVLPRPTTELADLLKALDPLIELGQDLTRYLGQIRPLGRDRALATSAGVRIMRLAGSKGLTARATIVAAVEEGIIPRPERDPSEERRLLYVGMTRAREFLYLTWARRRVGPTARAGAPRVAQVRNYSTFLQGGPVESEDGDAYLATRWSA